LTEQRLFGKGACRAEIADSLWCRCHTKQARRTTP
jgi:hypothetical protein